MTEGRDLEWRLDRLIARWGEEVLYEYVFAPSLPRRLAPRPFFHPLRTLHGRPVTELRPPDHAWHLGLAYSWPIVDRWNLWGGPTYVRDQGYVELDNQGEIRHLRWNGLEEDLEWLDVGGERIALEHRSLGQAAVDEEAGAWHLDLSCVIRNSRDRTLRLGSPTTEGRPDAGYAGLAWRGVPELRHATVALDLPAPGPAMGARSRWLSLSGDDLTVALIEHPENPGVPNRWFVRTDPYVLVTSSPVYDRPLELEPGASLTLRHRILVADGICDAGHIDRTAAAFAGVPA